MESMKEEESAIDIECEIKLTEGEKQLFDLLLEYIRVKDVRVTLRSAGGWVRDKLLDKDCDDIDLSLDTMKGEKFMEGLSEYLSEIGKDDLMSGHGVIKCNPDKSKHLETVTFKLLGYDIDVSNLRCDEYADPLKKSSETKFGTPLEDALRRDLTINSMFYNINLGRIEDCTGFGLSDLKTGIIRTPLDPILTYKDDPVRILRTIRFATKFSFEIDSAALKAIKSEEIQFMLSYKVSRERIKTELTKILIHPNAEFGLRAIYDNQLWPIVFQMPEKCVELADSVFYQQKQKESYELSIHAAKEIKNVLELPTFSTEYSREDAQLLTLMTAISFPYTEIYFKSGKGAPMSLPYYLSFESLRFPDKYLKVCTIVMTACDSALFFKRVVRKPYLENFDQIAQVMKKQGNTWEMALQIAMMQDILQEGEGMALPYKELVKFIQDTRLDTAYLLKPLIDGKEIMKHFKLAKQGPMIGKIGNSIYLWQCRNREKSLTQLIEAIEANQDSFLS